MGCDIHMWAEIRKRDGWDIVGKDFDNPYYTQNEPTTTDDDGWVWNPTKTEHPYNERNYELYAILAGVRNRFEVEPIDDPRGVPQDATPEYQKEVNEWGLDGHSHSWLTLADIDKYDWKKGVRIGGYVTPEQYQVFKETGRPREYCQGVCGGNVRKISNANMEDLIRSQHATEHDYTHIEWDEPYYEAAGKAWWNAVEQLKAYGKPEDVRIVFFFDN